MTGMADIDVGRLQAYLRRAGPLLRASTPVVERRSGRDAPTPARLQACVAALGSPLAAARRAGAFANPWAIAGLKRDEVRTAAVLAWLLDPAGSHGGGDAYAQALWLSVTGEKPPFELTGLRAATTEQCPLGDDANRVDVVLEGEHFLIFIEVKIDAPLRERQLEDYEVALQKKAKHLGKKAQLLFLSLTRHVPPDGCIAFHWRDVGSAIRQAARSLAPDGHDGRLPLAFAEHIDRLQG